jgi:hypothetical protein
MTHSDGETPHASPGERIYPVPEAWAGRAQLGRAGYEAMAEAARRDPQAFWAEQGRRLDWSRPFTRVKDVSFDKGDFRIRWFDDGQLNVAYNCIDRHLPHRRDQQRSSGRATSRTRTARSPTRSCTTKSAGWPMC